MKIIIEFVDAAEDIVMDGIRSIAGEMKALEHPPLKLSYPDEEEKAPREASNRVTYTTTDKGDRTQFDGVKETIRMYIMNHPGCTAQEVETETGQGRKSVESAIHGLRRRGIIRSVQA